MGVPSKHRESVTLTGGLRAALAAYAKDHQISKSAAILVFIMAGLGVDRNGQPFEIESVAGKVARRGRV